MRRKRDFYEAAPVPSSIARQDWTHMMERAERSGLTLQTKKGSTGLLFSARILAPILDGGLRHIVLAAIQYSLGRHTYDVGHLRQISALAPQEFTHICVALREQIDIFLSHEHYLQIVVRRAGRGKRSL